MLTELVLTQISNLEPHLSQTCLLTSPLNFEWWKQNGSNS